MIRAVWLIGLFASMSAWALVPGERIDDFRLMDHQGMSHHLYYYDDASAIVVMVQANGCETVRSALPELKALRDAYAARGVQFFLLNSSLQDDRASIAREAQDLNIDLPVLVDDAQLIGESLGLTRTAEVLVIDPKSWTLAYRGAIDDRSSDGSGTATASNHYLQAALDGVLSGTAIQVTHTEPQGTPIDFPARAQQSQFAQISYSETIGPMLVEHCASCHRPGGIGPWAMTDYNMVRGFSLMMREVLRTQRMPPWHADPSIGHFSNDRSLSRAQLQTLVHWIEAGAPRGEGPDPLLDYQYAYDEWGELGEPDLVIDIPPTDVPATGVVDYQYKYVTNPLDHDVWVRASQIVPGDRAVLHHVITRFGEMQVEGPRAGRLSRRGGGGLAGYVPGMIERELPDGTGTLLPAGATIEFQMHYTTYGKPATDHSRLAIYFHDQPPQHEIHSMILLNPRIRIPANTKSHRESAERLFDHDVLVYSLLPHAHYRGKASEFKAVYPDGREEVLLWVPNYDFNWQTTYVLEEPKLLPAGTKMVHTTWWDNSAQNPANPDPNRVVPWGQQSWDEMLFGAVSYRELDASELAELKAAGRALASSE